MSDKQMYYLGYNFGDDPFQSAKDFLNENELPGHHAEEIVEFIVQNVPFELRNYGVEDDMEIEGRFSAQDAQKHEISHEPDLNPHLLFPSYYVKVETANFDGILKKVKSLNVEISDEWKMNENEMNLFVDLISLLKNKKKPQVAHYQLMLKLLQWPKKDVFPFVDLMRFFIEDFNLNVKDILSIGFAQDSNDTLRMLTIRFLSNLFNSKLESFLMDNFDSILKETSVESKNLNVRTSYSHLLINYSAKLCKMFDSEFDEKKLKIFNLLLESLKKETGGAIDLNLLIGLGTICYNHPMLKKKLKENSSLLFEKLKSNDQECHLTINHLLKLE
jgi:phospholipase A-2-activating protein